MTDVDASINAVRKAARRFDALYTAMTTVQRELLGLTRELDPEAARRLSDGEQADLARKLDQLTEMLGDLNRFRAPGRQEPAYRDYRVGLPRDTRQRLEQRPLGRSEIVTAFLLGHRATHFPILADLLEQLSREGILDQAGPDIHIRDLLASMTLMGPTSAAKVLVAAEVPLDITMDQLGPGDIDRLARILRIWADRGVPRDAPSTPDQATEGP